jgi:surfeit locus 1 family protein
VNARFRFVLLTAGAVVAMAATLMLGRWQLSRADQKMALEASVLRQGAMPALSGSSLVAITDPASILHRNVVVAGRWVGQHTVYLDNRQMNGKPGWYVVTPLRLEGSDAVVLVQRGWVARNFIDRMNVPDIETPNGVVEVRGQIVPPPGKLYELGAPESGRIRQNLDLPAFAAETQLPLKAWSIQQTGSLSDGLLRQWPAPATGVQKHQGYAFQWFALSGLIFILYVWFQIVRRFIQARRG